MTQPTWPYDLPRSGRDAISFAIDFLDTSLFREYDLRGKVASAPPTTDVAINEFVANRIGRAFGTFLSRRDITDVVIGYDARSYSEWLCNAIVLGLMSTGANVHMLGMTTTPMVYFAQHHLSVPAGVSITASHNPNGWSGFKLSHAPSITLGPDEIAELKQIAESRDFATGTGTYREQSVTDAYTDHLASIYPAPRKLRVVVDGGNSISGPIAELAFTKAGYDVVSVNRELDWSFPNHEPDPESVEARQQIKAAVIEHAAEVGISLDGDGDRLGITDEHGGIVWSDAVLAVFAKDVLAHAPGATIVYDVKCSRAVTEVIEQAGGNPLMWMTGHSHIKTKMRDIKAPFAGERSGHFFDGLDYFGYDDGVFSGLKFLKIAAADGRPVSAIIGDLPAYVSTPTMQADSPDDEKYEAVETFAKYAETIGARELVRINGVRAEFDEGWILVRASSNLPALVIIAEATSQDELDKLYRLLRTGLDGVPSVGKTWMNDPWQGGPSH